MAIAISDFVQQHPSIKYLMFLGLLVGVTIPIDLFGVQFRLGNIFYVPFAIIINALTCATGFCINMTFEIFFVLMFMLFLVVFVGWNSK